MTKRFDSDRRDVTPRPELADSPLRGARAGIGMNGPTASILTAPTTCPCTETG